LPIVKQHLTERIMRRYALAGTRKDLLTCAKLLAAAPKPEHAAELMKGFELAFQGRSLTNLPNELVDVMAQVGGGSTALRIRRNDAAAIAEALKLIQDDKADKTQRLQYLQVLGEVSQPQSVPVLLGVAKQSPDRDIRTAALAALQLYNEPSIPAQVVGFYKNLQDDVAPVAATLLASRKPWAVDFLQAVDTGTVPAAAVPVSAVRKMLLHDDDRIRALVEKHWGAVQGATTDQMRQQIEHLVEVISASSGNPYKGKQLYAENCGKCHKLFELGGEVGPDLTAYKRDNLERMLLNVVNPSAEIREGFENYVVVTQDGRVVNGFLADQDNRVVVLRGVDGQNQIIPRDDIDDMHAIPRSVMPDGTLDKLADQQVRDLFAYLRSAQPVP
jgi:putative heme-binding domain-containing protein